MVIDCHAHIMEHLSGIGARGEVRPIGRGKVRFLDGTEQQVIPPSYGDKEFLAETLLNLMDSAGVDKAVLLHGLLYGLQNEYIFETAVKYPQRFIPSGSLDPCMEQAEMVLERLIEHYGFRILKFELSTGAGMTGLHRDLKIDGEEFEKIYQRAEQADVTIVFDIGSRGMRSYQIDEVVNAAKRHPDITIVLCHLLAADGRELEGWKADLKKLAACENLVFDITAVPWNVKEAYPFPTSLQLVCEAKNIVGAERMMWGSDVPQLLVIDEYQKLYEYLFVGNKLSASELDYILFQTAQRVYLKERHG